MSRAGYRPRRTRSASDKLCHTLRGVQEPKPSITLVQLVPRAAHVAGSASDSDVRESCSRRILRATSSVAPLARNRVSYGAFQVSSRPGRGQWSTCRLHSPVSTGNSYRSWVVSWRIIWTFRRSSTKRQSTLFVLHCRMVNQVVLEGFETSLLVTRISDGRYKRKRSTRCWFPNGGLVSTLLCPS